MRNKGYTFLVNVGYEIIPLVCLYCQSISHTFYTYKHNMISLKHDEFYMRNLLSEYSVNIFIFEKIYLKKVKYYKVGDNNDVIFIHYLTIDMAILRINNVSAHDYVDIVLVVSCNNDYKVSLVTWAG